MATIPVDSRVNSKTAEFFSRQHRMLIDGRFVLAASGKTFPVYNPATGEVVAQVPEAEAEDVDRAVTAARRAFDDGPWSKMSTSQRGQLIWKMADLLEANLEEFAEIESLDNGKPFSVARVADLPLAIDMFRYMAGWATKISGSTLNFSTPGAFHSYTLREPIGVVGQIIPWNFPLLMAVWKLAPALAAGCCVVLKVAEQTPMSALRLAELFDQAGFPPGVVNILTGYRRRCRRTPGRTSAGRQNRFHRIDRSWQADRESLRRQPEKGKPRVGWQEPGHHLPRCRPGTRYPRRGQRYLLQPGTMLLRRITSVRA